MEGRVWGLTEAGFLACGDCGSICSLQVWDPSFQELCKTPPAWSILWAYEIPPSHDVLGAPRKEAHLTSKALSRPNITLWTLNPPLLGESSSKLWGFMGSSVPFGFRFFQGDASFNPPPPLQFLLPDCCGNFPSFLREEVDIPSEVTSREVGGEAARPESSTSRPSLSIHLHPWG